MVTPVKNQGDCGDCWAHATVEAVESHWAIRHPGRLWTLSQQQVTDCTPNPNDCGGFGGCQGSLYELGWDLMKNSVVASEWMWPFTSYNGVSAYPVCKPPTPDGTRVNVTGYKHVGDGIGKATAELLMDAVAHVGPVAITVAAIPFVHYESGVFDECSYPMTLDHDIVLEGYGTDEKSGKDYWLVRNSWSPAWGENGYIRFLRNPTPDCGVITDNQDGIGCKDDPVNITGCGECGILLDPAYPTVA